MELDCFLSDNTFETDLYHHSAFGSNETRCYADRCHDDFCAKIFPSMNSMNNFSSIALPDFCHENCGQFPNNFLVTQENDSSISENAVPPIVVYELNRFADDVELNCHYPTMKLCIQRCLPKVVAVVWIFPYLFIL